MTKEDKEEIVADVFVSFWEHLDGYDFDNRESAKKYLAVIAKNLSLNKYRDNRRHAHAQLEEGYEPVEKGENTESIILREEAKQAILEALKELPEDDRKCFILYYFYDMSIEEIGQHIHRNRNTIKSRLSRGRTKLKTILSERGITDESLYF